MAYTRGVLTTGAGSVGYVQSIDFSEGGEEVLIKDENGITQVADLYDTLFEVTVNAKFDRAQTIPDRGAVVTLAATPKTAWNTKYTVLTDTVNEVNTDAGTVTLNLRRFEDGDVPAEA